MNQTSRWTVAAAAVFFCFLAPLSAPAAPPPAVMKAGFAEADITPEIGMEQPGGYGKSYHRKLHDPCKVRSAVFDDGQRRVVILGVDALGIHRETVQAVRRQIAEKTGIPAEAILISASHSHSSGPLCGVRPGQYDHASPLVQKLAYEQSTAVNPAYCALVERQLVAAACQADAARTEVRAGAGKGIEDQVAFNRRFRMKNGLTFTHPGVGNPDILEPAGPTDPEVGVIGVWNPQGKLLGCVVNFACHATTSPGGISANYIYYLEQAVRGFFGPQAIVVFLPGASGDVTQVNNLSQTANPEAERWARLVGGRVGAEAVKVLLSMQPGTLTPVDARSKVLEIKRRVPAADRVRQALEIVQKDPKQVGPAEWSFAKETVLLDALLQKSPVVPVEVQVVEIGPVVLMANPAEYFCQFGLDMKKQSPFPLTFPVTLANDCIGYVPTTEAFGPHGGGYETRLTSYSNLEVTAGDRIAAAALELARQMQPGPIPTPPKPSPFKTPWTYGNVPPERE
jgi:hypothetical protein